MAYSPEVLSRARFRLAEEKAAREQEFTRHKAIAYEKSPRLAEIDRQLSVTVAQAVALSFQKGEDTTAAIEKLKQENLSLQQERAAILAAFGEGYLDNTPICDRCGGTGYVGETMCECLGELCRQEQKKELTQLLSAGNARFEQFRLDVYSDRYNDSFGCSPRQMQQLILNRCQRYTRDFAPDSGNLLFSGAPGLGKTFLSACIARGVANRGYSVVYETAIKLFSAFEAAKFGDYSQENQEKTEKYLKCDLLIIDDLGSEMTTQLTMSALYTVVNTRLMEGLSTIISTNLTAEAIKSRYTPAICSRILGMYQLMQFLGDDLRLSQ